MQLELIIDAFGKCSLAAKFDAIGHVDVSFRILEFQHFRILES